MPSETNQTEGALCPRCGAQIAPSLLSCPRCQRLVHAEELKRLAEQAEQAEQTQDRSAALGAWRRALELLPSDSRQHEALVARVTALGRQVDEAAPQTARRDSHASDGGGTKSAWAKSAVGLGTAGLLLWKFKFIAVLALTKAKFLLLGLTKASTLFSMLLSLGVYWSAWGWLFAVGLVISIYIHEMGHVAALQRYGIRASAPMFIPGIGAIVRLQQRLVNAREDARVGLAGPLWGLAAAAGFYALSLISGWVGWAAVAKVGAWINLFNLIPVWQLDGARGFRSLSRFEAWLVVATIGLMWFLTAEGLLALIFLVAVWRAWSTPAVVKPDRTALLQFVLLVVILSLMCLIPAGPSAETEQAAALAP